MSDSITVRQRIVIAGGGFAGFHAARTLSRTVNRRRWLRRTGTDQVEIVLISPTDYFLYLPLLPEVAAGILDPRRVAVPLADAGPGVRTVPGTVDEVHIAARRVGFTDPEGIQRTTSYDRLLLTVGSVGRLLPVPGLTEHAIGFRSIRESLALRDHLVRQIELAAAAGVAPAASSSGPDGAPGRFAAAEQDARCTFVVVGAGYTGTEVAAHGQLLTRAIAGNYPALRHQQIRWLLLETAPRVLPELDRHLSATAHRVLTGRGVEIRTGTTIEKAADDGVLTSDGEFVPTRSLIWCVGVRPDPLVGTLGLATSAGRLSVDEYLGVPGHPEIFACGDAAAVPDLTRPGEITAMTAQHAVRQGRRVAGNIAASLGYGRRRPYRHHDLGFTVDLGGAKAAANPAGLRLSGVPAKAVTRGYHLSAIPANKIRIASDWLLDAVLPRQAVQLGLLEEPPRIPSELQHPQPH
jgi:NADH:ubiquinone reductase (H+-translocating)